MKISLNFVLRLSAEKPQPASKAMTTEIVRPEIKHVVPVSFLRRMIAEVVDENCIENIRTLDDLDLQSVGIDDERKQA